MGIYESIKAGVEVGRKVDNIEGMKQLLDVQVVAGPISSQSTLRDLGCEVPRDTWLPLSECGAPRGMIYEWNGKFKQFS